MKIIPIHNGTLTLVESKAYCPHCKAHLSFEQIEKRFARQDKSYIRMKCGCGKFIGVTSNIMGDFVAYDINEQILNQ